MMGMCVSREREGLSRGSEINKYLASVSRYRQLYDDSTERQRVREWCLMGFVVEEACLFIN